MSNMYPFQHTTAMNRARDSMGNRVSSGSTGDFDVEVFLADEDTVTTGDGVDPSPVSTGKAVYKAGGEYAGIYNVTVAGAYTLHVRTLQHQFE